MWILWKINFSHCNILIFGLTFSHWMAIPITGVLYTFSIHPFPSQEVLQELMGDRNLERFRVEYEKLHRALTKSHESEKRLMNKCRELNSGGVIKTPYHIATMAEKKKHNEHKNTNNKTKTKEKQKTTKNLMETCTNCISEIVFYWMWKSDNFLFFSPQRLLLILRK